jgi:hypothetical protein
VDNLKAQAEAFVALRDSAVPDLKEMSGQEKLPVLKLPDGATVNGGSSIVDWAKANAPAARPASA